MMAQVVNTPCTRCNGAHAPWSCPLLGMGQVLRARHATLCCLSTCGEMFVNEGPMQERSRIISVGDMGYMHTDCALSILEPYDGHLPGAPSLEERVEDLCMGCPISIQAVRSAPLRASACERD